MRFGIIYYGTEARDRGLDQLCQSLTSLGHQPHIVTRRPKHLEPVTEFNGVPVTQLPSGSARQFHSLSSPMPFNWIWKRWVTFLSRDLGWDGVFVRETPLSWPIIRAARDLHIPVFLDMRENLSAMYAAGAKERPINRVLRSGKMVRFYESLVLPRFDHVFTVTRELGKWVARTYAIPASKISTLGNYPSNVFLDSADRALESSGTQSRKRPVRMVHTGYIKENRGLQDLFHALRIVINVGADVVLRIIGEGMYLETLKKLGSRLGIEKRIEFVGMLSPLDVPKALSRCDIGVCAYLLNEHTHLTFPGKLFEYMSVGLPILTSARKPVVRIVEQTGCGIIYKSRRAEEIADCILSLARNREMREEMGCRGRGAVINHYNWKTNLGSLERVLNGYPQS